MGLSHPCHFFLHKIKPDVSSAFSSNNKFSQLCQTFKSDQYWVINSYSPPHKLNRPYSPFQQNPLTVNIK